MIRGPAPRRVLVTGGASGLGLALVHAFADRGDQVLATDVHDHAPPSALPDSASYRRLDVRDDADWKLALAWVTDEWGGLDVLVNNAGIAQGGRIELLTMDDWQRIVEINLFGVVRGCRTFVPLMKAQRSGHIVNTASMAGLVHPPMMSSYNAVKAGVVALSETLHHELEPEGIVVSAVCPSFFKTNLAASLNTSDPEMAGLAHMLVTDSDVTAEEIAVTVMAGIDRRRQLILTDSEGRLAYWAKRYARPLYERRMAEITATFRKAVAGEAARTGRTTS